MTSPTAWIKEATFSDGSVVAFDENDIIVFVGPNNSGKSASLKDILEKSKNHSSECNVVKEIKIHREGELEDVISWLKTVSKRQTQNPSNPGYSRLGVTVHENQAQHSWVNTLDSLDQLAPFFIYHLSTESRLQAANPATNISLTNDPLVHPIHYLQKYDEREAKVSSYFKSAFGQDLIVHRNAGNNVPLYCGNRPELNEGEDRVSIGYIEKLEKLSTLHTQGDGMRSFVGVILHSLVVDHSTVLIDEPEAFLHPPQARLLARMLVENAPDKRQLFVATHSSDFIKGLLDADTDRVRIIRVQRDGSINNIKELNNVGIVSVWGDPLLRHSNILDGLFHKKVVICESDSDCRFYAAVLDSIFEENSSAPKPDIMFTHCGGKDRMPIVIKALCALGVPVVVISDFDVLNKENPLKKIYENLGGDWLDISDDWKKVKTAIEQKKAELSSDEVKKDINKILQDVTEAKFPLKSRKEIDKIMKQSSPWSIAKTVGKSYIPNGDPTKFYEKMTARLKEKGLYVVEYGELEGFVRSVGNHGPKWVNEVLKKNLMNDPELLNARNFVEEFCKLTSA